MPEKRLSLRDAIRNLAGGDHPTDAVKEGRCMKPPIGCGRSLAARFEFRDGVSLAEYRITGLCQECQDKVEEAGRADEDR